MSLTFDQFTIVNFPTLEEERHVPRVEKQEESVRAYAFLKKGRNLQRPWAGMIRKGKKLKHIGYFESKDKALEFAKHAITVQDMFR